MKWIAYAWLALLLLVEVAVPLTVVAMLAVGFWKHERARKVTG